MKFEERFNEICKFSDPDFNDLDDFNKEIFTSVKNFNEAYESFKKEHGLENLYFSRVVHIEYPSNMITEVYYVITDLYLTFLDVNGILPKGERAVIETFLLKEQYLYNTEKEWLFRDSMFAALEQQDKYLNQGDCKVFKSSSFVGVTERIKLSNPSNGLPGMIIDRIPMLEEDLKIK